jgi:hypothetical protein
MSLGRDLLATAIHQEYDAEWAADWQQDDYGYSRAIRYKFWLRNSQIRSGHIMGGIGGRPARLSLTKRTHGSTPHMAKMRQGSIEIAKKGVRYDKIRKNQELVNAKGVVISKYKPDVQGINTKTGVMHIREARITQTRVAAEARRDEYLRAALAEGLELDYQIID